MRGKAIPIATELKATLRACKAEAEEDYRKNAYVTTGERSASTSSYAIVTKFVAC